MQSDALQCGAVRCCAMRCGAMPCGNNAISMGVVRGMANAVQPTANGMGVAGHRAALSASPHCCGYRWSAKTTEFVLQSAQRNIGNTPHLTAQHRCTAPQVTGRRYRSQSLQPGSRRCRCTRPRCLQNSMGVLCSGTSTCHTVGAGCGLPCPRRTSRSGTRPGHQPRQSRTTRHRAWDP